MPETVIYEKQELAAEIGQSIAWVTLNRPEVLNALNLEMRDELWMVMGAVRADPDVGVVILRGAGDQAFSSGADLADFGTAPSYVDARRGRRERDLWGLMASVEKPLIAAVRGYALGAGCEMSLLCDLRIAAEDARFGMPEVNLGYIPSAGGTQTLPRLIAPGTALYMVLSADFVDAQTALDSGLVQWAVPAGHQQIRPEEVARAILSRPQAAVRRTKEAVVRGLDLSLAEGLALEARLARAV
jgi:enoyl-CoA hydratase